jgi:hypothetical protein
MRTKHQEKKVMIQVQVCRRQRQRRQDYNNTSTFFFKKKKKVELKISRNHQALKETHSEKSFLDSP